ncbi:unnamed protein product, partial [marine sediment metagenome]
MPRKRKTPGGEAKQLRASKVLEDRRDEARQVVEAVLIPPAAGTKPSFDTLITQAQRVYAMADRLGPAGMQAALAAIITTGKLLQIEQQQQSGHSVEDDTTILHGTREEVEAKIMRRIS